MPILHCISTTRNATILAPFGMSLIIEHLIEGNDTNDRDWEEVWSSSHVEGFADTPEANDCTEGMQELEDAAADAQWSNALGDRQGNFSNVIQIGRHLINKSHVIAYLYYAKLISLTDRLHCIA
jgi:hypothetical protein